MLRQVAAGRGCWVVQARTVGLTRRQASTRKKINRVGLVQSVAWHFSRAGGKGRLQEQQANPSPK
jgi:hypothetical protein